MKRTGALVVAALAGWFPPACSSERAEPNRPALGRHEPQAARSIGANATPSADASADAMSVDAVAIASPRDLDEALVMLRSRQLDAAADVIAARVAQQKPKMRLDAKQAFAAAHALLEIADREPIRALHGVMPRSTVELARAVRERGVTIDEADEIARYLVAVTAKLALQRLSVFDDNHSHVTGRDWHEIDYSGEGMTWQKQREFWAPRGVVSFKRAAYIHAYFVGAEPMEHWKRVYKPRGRMADVAAP